MRNIYKLLVVFSLITSTFIFAGYTTVDDLMDEPIKSPSLQNVVRKKIRLSNGLEAFLVSDPGAKKSAAALAVGVGFNHEPYEHVGVAHFVEHMLFLGTEKYPVEKDYHEFIKSRGGVNNAYTASDRTVYFFQINNDHMSEALDRFSTFFVSPLFNPSGLERERKAVNEEFLYRANLDPVRLHMVQTNLLDENTNAHLWRCGDENTLSKISRDEIVEWYNANYSANIMHLAVYSSMPMDQLIQEVDACFSEIENKNVQPKTLPRPLVKSENLAKMVYVEPIKDVKKMSIFWEMPSQYAQDLDYHTSDLVGLTLSEDSPNSLATFLKEQGYILSMGSGLDTYDSKTAFFEVDFSLTPKGVENREQIITHLFEAIRSIEKSGIPRYRYEELSSISKLGYQYQSRPEAGEFVEHSAAKMLYEPLETFPQKTLWPTSYHSQRCKDFLSHLQASTAVYTVMAPTNELQKNLDRKEELCQISYGVEQLQSPTLSGWLHASSNQFAVSPPNPYVANNLDLVTSAQDCEDAPSLIADNGKMQVYYQADQDYQLPEATYSVFMLSPTMQDNPQNHVLSDLFKLSVTERLSMHLDQGELAGLNSGVGLNSKFGYNVQVGGYSQKAQPFLKEVLTEVRSHQPRESDFNKFKELLTRSYSNQKKKIPYEQAFEIANSLLIENYSTSETKLEAIDQISFADFQNYCSELSDEVYIRAMIYGNVTKAQAQDFAASLGTAFQDSRAYPKSEHFKRGILDLKAHQRPSYLSQSIDQPGNSTMLMIGHGALDHRERAAFMVLSKAIGPPFFDTLRTKQQVGYIVHAFPREYDQKYFSAFVAQSNACSTRDLLARYELFCEEFLSTLGSSEFDLDKFNTVKESLLTELYQPPVSIADKGSELTALAFEYEDFDRRTKSIEALDGLNFQEFIDFSYRVLGRQNNKRVAVFIDGEMSSMPSLSYVPIQDLSHFKSENSYSSDKMVNPIEQVHISDE